MCCSLWKNQLPSLPPLSPLSPPLSARFNMVFSETPDMSDSNQDFAQRGQQQAPPPPPPPPPQNSTGERNMDPRGPTNSGSSSRMGTGPSPSGNWNGNNHLGDGQQPQDALPTMAGHVVQEPSYQGYPQKTHQNRQQNGVGHYRGHPNHSHSERYTPYHRPPLPNHNSDPRSNWR